MTETSHSQLDEYLDPKSRHRFLLRFHPELERGFEAQQGKVRLRENIIASAVACVLYDSFLISDYLLNPADIWHCIVLRLFVFTPTALAAMGLAYRWRPAYVRDSVCLVLTALAGGCMLSIGVGHTSTMSAMAQGGLLVVMSFGTLILRVSLPYVAAINMILFCEDAVFLYGDRCLNSGEKVSAMLLAGTFVLLSIIANYRTEGLERRQFLLFLKEDQRSRKYALLSRDLADISKHDGLTGLYNRRHFDYYLRMVWDAARLDAAPVSIIMIDIDHFKGMNDSFGHLFGDQVLTAVADVLRSSIRGREDAVARFGGDEFVIILPETDRDDAYETAQRLCERARKVLLTAPTSGAPLPLTLSCGVSSALPADLHDATALIAQADRELYRAKRLGRNRVCCAPKPSKTQRSQ